MTVQYGQLQFEGFLMDAIRRPAAWLSASMVIASGLYGCAAVPAAGPTPGPRAAASYASAQSFAAPSAPWPADGWWRAYGDTQLSALIETALQGTPSIAQAEARMRQAQATAAQTRSSYWPSLELDANGGEVKESLNQGFPPQFAQYLPRGYNSDGYVALKFDYEFDFWGKNRSAVAAAVSDLRATQAEAAEARLALSTGIALAYADLARLYAEYEVARRTVQVKEETLGLVSRRVDNGLDTRAELEQARAAAPAARAQMAALDEQIAQTRNRIAALMGAGRHPGASFAPPAAAQLQALPLPAPAA